MPHARKRPERPARTNPALDDSALIEFHKIKDQYPVMDGVTLAALLNPYAPVPATVRVTREEPTELENAA